MTGNTLPFASDSLPAATNGFDSTWARIRHELVYLSFAVQEAALLTPLALVIMAWTRFWPPWLVFLWLLLLMLLPLNLIRLMGVLQLDRTRQQRIMVAAMVVTVFTSWRLLLYEASSPLDVSWLRQFATNMAEGGNLVWTRDLSVFLFTVLAWWRGMRLAVKPLEITNAGLRLRVGGLIIAPIIAWLGASFLTAGVVPFIVLFFLASLATVALVRAEQIEADRSGHAATLNPTWLATVLAAGLGIVLLGGLLAAFISGESLFEVLAFLSPVWRALQFGGTVAGLTLFELLRPLLDVLSSVLQAVAEVLAILFGRVSEGIRFLTPGTIDQSAPLIPEPTVEGFTAPAGTGKVVAAVLMLALIGVVAWGLSRLYRQATFAARDSRPSEPLAGTDDGQDRFLERFMRRLGFRQWRAAASIRRIYEAMCQAAAAAGFPRLESETPYEYLTTLTRAWPENRADTHLITEAFIRIRYGELPETQEELDAIRAAWRRLEAAESHRLDKSPEPVPSLEKRL